MHTQLLWQNKSNNHDKFSEIVTPVLNISCYVITLVSISNP